MNFTELLSKTITAKPIKITDKDMHYYETDDINGLKLFMYKFNQFPNKIFSSLENEETKRDAKANFFKPEFDIVTFVKDIQKLYTDELYIQVAQKRYVKNDEEKLTSDSYKIIFLFEKSQIVISMTPDYDSENIVIYYANHNTVEPILNILKDDKYIIKDKVKRPSKKISFITRSQSGFGILEGDIKQMEVDLDKHYNDGFRDVDNKINKFLNEESTTGLVILKGEKGTGKTTYIRRLVNSTERRFVYLTKELAHNLTDPSFITFLGSIRDSVLVIEDCENLVKSRDNNNNDTGISNLLNLCDGLLSDVFNIKIIVTFNTDVKNIDTALLRKGRLVCIHDFTKLSVEKSNALLKELNIDYTTTEPMAICDIFNFEDETGAEKEETKNKIGF